jgi:general stress protein YciG
MQKKKKGKKEIPAEVREYMSQMGQKGGKSATGEKKKRSPEHYKHMTECRAKALSDRNGKWKKD